MFTGIIDHCGEITALNAQVNQSTLWIRTTFTELELGESIAIDGVCLTVTAIKGNEFSVDVSPETLKLTAAGSYEVGQKINLERSLRVGDRLGGHHVSGHVDAALIVKNINAVGDYHECIFEGIKKEHRPYLIKKGSVALNGVSLTVNEVDDNTLSVMIIPHTWQRTIMQYYRIGQKVNVEYDQTAKLIIQQVKLMKEAVVCE